MKHFVAILLVLTVSTIALADYPPKKTPAPNQVQEPLSPEEVHSLIFQIIGQLVPVGPEWQEVPKENGKNSPPNRPAEEPKEEVAPPPPEEDDAPVVAKKPIPTVIKQKPVKVQKPNFSAVPKKTAPTPNNKKKHNK